jgi:hypothetical protein
MDVTAYKNIAAERAVSPTGRAVVALSHASSQTPPSAPTRMTNESRGAVHVFALVLKLAIEWRKQPVSAACKAPAVFSSVADCCESTLDAG